MRVCCIPLAGLPTVVLSGEWWIVAVSVHHTLARVRNTRIAVGWSRLGKPGTMSIVVWPFVITGTRMTDYERVLAGHDL